MIDPQTEETASLYVLDLLEPEDREAFEARLDASPALRKHVRELRQGLFAPLKESQADDRPDLLAGILERAAGPSVPVADRHAARPASLPWAWIWAAAAMLLLVLNIGLLRVLSGDGDQGSTGVPGGAVVAESPDTGAGAGSTANPSLIEARLERVQSLLAGTENELTEALAERDALADENRQIRDHNALWQREYTRLASRILPFFEPNEGLSRFTVIEMVDRQAYEQNLPRLGFTDLAGHFLTGGENIGGINPDDFIGPVVEGAGLSSASSEPTEAGLNPFQRGGSASAGSAEGASAVGDEPPRSAGFTVWRDDEQTGFLDLYNLPAADEGRQAYLWVRASEVEAYRPVGALPELENGTGSFFYSVDEPNFTPTEILITAEPEEGPSTEPAGDILLRGP